MVNLITVITTPEIMPMRHGHGPMGLIFDAVKQ